MKRVILTFMLAFALLIAANAKAPVHHSNAKTNSSTIQKVDLSNFIYNRPFFETYHSAMEMNIEDDCHMYAAVEVISFAVDCNVDVGEAAILLYDDLYSECMSVGGNIAPAVNIC